MSHRLETGHGRRHRRTRLAALTCAAALAPLLLACDGPDRAEPAALGGAPSSAGATGYAIGPQPGPDRDLGATENPYAGDPNALAEGRRLFVWFNCSGCHGGRAGGGMGPSLRDATWLYGSGDADIFNSIAQGRAHGMPAWGTKVPTEQIWKLAAYVRSLDTEAEPDAPPPNPVYPDPPPRRDLPGQEAGGE